MNYEHTKVYEHLITIQLSVPDLSVIDFIPNLGKEAPRHEVQHHGHGYKNSPEESAHNHGASWRPGTWTETDKQTSQIKFKLQYRRQRSCHSWTRQKTEMFWTLKFVGFFLEMCTFPQAFSLSCFI